jgi:RNA polymerase sigma factor (sigma-70 family)
VRSTFAGKEPAGTGQIKGVTDDRQRFEGLFRTHYTALTRYAIRRVGPTNAPEVVSETFLVAWRRLGDVPDNALPWLYATARRITANERRRWTRAARLADRLSGDGRDDPLADHADHVADRLRVHYVLDRLREKDREALLLTAWEQLSAPEAAHVLGCRETTFHVRLHRARRRFVQLLDEHDRATDPPADTRTSPLARGISS